MSQLRYLLVMRHAQHEPADPPAADVPPAPAAAPRRAVRRRLTDAGIQATQRVAERLAEQASPFGAGLQLGSILAADSEEARLTAELVQRTCAATTLRLLPALTPEGACARQRAEHPATTELHADLVGALLHREVQAAAAEGTAPGANAALVVGHQPLLGWLTHAAVKASFPLAHSEVLCLDLQSPEPHLPRWVISPSAPQITAALKEKIKSKMQLAGLLGGFITSGLGFLLGALTDTSRLPPIGGHWALFLGGGLLLFGALLLYLATLCSYDSLLMPESLWIETPAGAAHRPAWVVARPPSAVQWVLYQNMIRIWSWQFLPATYLLLAGLLLLGGAVAAERVFPGTGILGWFLMGAAASALVGSAYQAVTGKHKALWQSARRCPGVRLKFRHVCGPWLGSED